MPATLLIRKLSNKIIDVAVQTSCAELVAVRLPLSPGQRWCLAGSIGSSALSNLRESWPNWPRRTRCGEGAHDGQSAALASNIGRLPTLLIKN